jgi:hypothetical protein
VKYFIVEGILLRHDSPGNILYGYALEAAGWSLSIVEVAAGIFQKSREEYWGRWDDDPVDAYWVRFGWTNWPGD